jgi:hypothetical protein
MSQQPETVGASASFRLIALMAGTALLLLALLLWAMFGGAVFSQVGAGVWALCF